MRTFWRRYRDGSKLPRTAFWVAIAAAVLGGAIIPIERDTGSGSWSWGSDGLASAMFAGLVVQGLSLRRDRRRRRQAQL